jgi:hypothetical protein
MWQLKEALGLRVSGVVSWKLACRDVLSPREIREGYM